MRVKFVHAVSGEELAVLNDVYYPFPTGETVQINNDEYLVDEVKWRIVTVGDESKLMATVILTEEF